MLPPNPKLGGHLHQLSWQQLSHIKISTMAIGVTLTIQVTEDVFRRKAWSGGGKQQL
jgi:hypothetical protein